MSYRAYITGDTYSHRGRLRGAGYRFDRAAKAWTRDYDEPVTEEDAVRDVRRIDGIRNRGSFAAEIREV